MHAYLILLEIITIKNHRTAYNMYNVFTTGTRRSILQNENAQSLSDSPPVSVADQRGTRTYTHTPFRTLNYIFIIFIKIKMYTPYYLSHTCISFYACTVVCILFNNRGIGYSFERRNEPYEMNIRLFVDGQGSSGDGEGKG